MSLWSKFMRGVNAFRREFNVSTNAAENDLAVFNSWEARQMRYSMFWSFFENTAYDRANRWTQSMRESYAMYKFTRNVYNPAYRLGDFGRTHILGGPLDPEAGDGSKEPTALPIITDNVQLRKSASKLWRDSMWNVHKGTMGLWGCVLGDVGIRIVDNPNHGRVQLQLVHPTIIKDVEYDDVGNVRGYELEDERPDPLSKDKTRTAVYNELATRDGDLVVYRTTRNGQPYAWNGMTDTWAEPYGFMPFVMVQHNNVGGKWGWSELHAGQSKIREIDDIASKINDFIRKSVDAPMLIAGAMAPRRNAIKMTATETEYESYSSLQVTYPEAGRQDVPTLYAKDPQTKAQPLLADLDIAHSFGSVDRMLKELEREYPELETDIWGVGTDTSGRALRVARERVVTKVYERRANYDNALVRAMQMAFSIGGFRAYKGYEGFDLNSFKAGDMDFHIGMRPVFAEHMNDRVEGEKALWDAAISASTVGVGVDIFMGRMGMSDKEIKAVVDSEAFKLRMEQLKAAGTVANQQNAGAPGMNANAKAQDNLNPKQQKREAGNA